MIRIILTLLFIHSPLSAQILGQVSTEDPNCKSDTEVFIAKDKNLLFQIHVPISGNFEVKLNKGEYHIVAANKNGCLAEQKINFKGKQKSLNFLLTQLKADQKRRPANSGMTGAFCWECMRAGGYGVYSGPYVGPWWNTYGSMTYPNWGYPCMWSGWGCMGSMYPQGGPIVMGKPNIYIAGPNAKKAHLKIKQNGMLHLMASAPAHLEKGWKVDIKNNKFKIEKATYPYLFYDARADGGIQNIFGFCGNQQEVLAQMKDGLRGAKFPKGAVKDFSDYWSIKLPKNIEKFCVYPQETKKLDELVSIEVTGIKAHWVRLLYFVLPIPENIDKAPATVKNFINLIPEAWLQESQRIPASATHRIYEWGIAFPTY